MRVVDIDRYRDGKCKDKTRKKKYEDYGWKNSIEITRKQNKIKLKKEIGNGKDLATKRGV